MAEGNVQQQQQPVQPQKSGKKIGCWIAGCLIVLVGFIFFVSSIIGVVFWATKGPVKAIDEQLAFLKKGDIESAYALTSGDFRKVTNFMQFQQFVQANPSLAQNKSHFFTSRKIENDKGYVEGTLTAMDGSKSPVQYRLIKENDQWKILYIEFSPTGIKPVPSLSKETPAPQNHAPLS